VAGRNKTTRHSFIFLNKLLIGKMKDNSTIFTLPPSGRLGRGYIADGLSHGEGQPAHEVSSKQVIFNRRIPCRFRYRVSFCRGIPCRDSQRVSCDRRIPRSVSYRVSRSRGIHHTGCYDVCRGRRIPVAKQHRVSCGRRIPAAKQHRVSCERRIPRRDSQRVSREKTNLLTTASRRFCLREYGLA